MLRTFFTIVIGLAIVSAMLGRTHSSASHKPDAAQKAFDDESERVAELKAQNEPQFTNQDGAIELQRQRDGHFYADVRINGNFVHMLVDTGATDIALSRDDARTAGLATSIGMPDVVGEGADGAVHGEYAKLDRVELGPLTAEGLDAVVLNGGQTSLLGQSFLSKFSSVEIHGDTMILR
ncbi:MAG: TIGR02281 family clan AA aspartic protease [Sphingomonas sp.]|nr:TIGR02281 family clan AA aspartic protease [Sphingomonas sp.]MBW0008456.1 TIGR02281 family clan AA aspartic protease [Sphingomonas sp.]